MVKLGALINVPNQAGRQPLHMACRFGQSEVVMELVDLNAALNAKDRYGNQPLHIACTTEMIDAAILMVQRNAPLDEKNKEGRQPLHIACVKGLADVVVEMVEKGAPLMTLDKAGYHPLNYALSYSKKDENDTDMQDAVVCIMGHPKGRLLVTPDLVANTSWFEDMTLDALCVVASAWGNDEKPVHVTSRYLEPTLLADLIKGGMDINMVNASGNTPLHLVVMGRPHFLNEWR